ncbi:hypothetical protein ACW0PU_004710 [Escherichia coli]|jgi:hypothetical protein|uniref:Uncharacterized protein n=1 Tax=Salmonella enterica subsp. enterica serovar Agona TaxID=58095 RepID=A0A726I053_SALET|nr:hypothetical protein [Salmonella enterica subsp. enterica serovar Agona]
MITYLHFFLMAGAGACLHMLWRSWAGLDRLGLTQELARKAPGLRTKQNIAAAFLTAPFVMAAADWFDLMMVGQDVPIYSWFAVLCSVAFLGAAFFMLRDSAEILGGSWVTTRESALRALAAHQHEPDHFTGRTIEAEAQEVGK